MWYDLLSINEGVRANQVRVGEITYLVPQASWLQYVFQPASTSAGMSCHPQTI